ncbi:MAG: hypothetical protein MK226_07195 [Saprospiraceae bacterium]|nr:hypothetical protein [Saprospiraceae bacterium]
MAYKEIIKRLNLGTNPRKNGGLIIMSLIWFFLVLFAYLFHHPYYSKAISDFDYWGLLSSLVILLSATFWWIFKKLKRKFFRGGELYILVLLVQGVVVTYYGVSNDIFEDQIIKKIAYFFGFSFLLHFALLFILGLSYTLGELLMKHLRDYLSTLSFKLSSIALGFTMLGILMVLLGMLGFLNTFVLWFFLGVICLLRYKYFVVFFYDAFIRKISTNSLNYSSFIAFGLLVIFIAVSILGGIKAFPVGFDGAGLYMNKANLISQYAGLPAGGQAFNWSVIMSMGTVLFKSEVVSILLSHLVGLLCLVAVYSIARLYISVSASLWAALLFYSIPAVRFHIVFDEKVDLGFLFISLSSLLILLAYFKKRNKESQPLANLNIGRFRVSTDHILYLIIGLLTGFAFGIKYTALFNGISILCLLVYRKSGIYAAFGTLLLSLAALFLTGIYNFANLQLGEVTPILIGGLFMIAGLGLLFLIYRKKVSELYLVISFTSIFVIAAALPFIPWAIKNGMENKSWSISSLTEGKLNELEAWVPFKYRRPFKGGRKKNNYPQNQPKITKAKASQLKAKREEIQRYLGYEKGLPLYFSVPFDATTNINLPGKIYVDLGFIWLLLLPLLFFSVHSRRLGKNLLLQLLLFFFFLLFIWSAYPDKASLVSLLESHPQWFQHSFGAVYRNLAFILIDFTNLIKGLFEWSLNLDILTIILSMLLVLVAMHYLSSEKRQKMNDLFKGLLIFIASYSTLWWLLGNAIPWYVFPILSLLPIVLLYYREHPEDFMGQSNIRFSKHFIGCTLLIQILLNLLILFKDPNRGTEDHLIYQKPFIKYMTQPMEKQEVLAEFNPFSIEALKYMNSDLDQKIYRVGTFLNYHIKQNDKRVLEDNQLGRFERVSQWLIDPNYFIEILKINGFRYVLYDLNSAAIDKTPEKTLTKKNIDFVNQLLNPEQVRLVLTDRIIEDPSGGYIQLPNGRIYGRLGLSGTIVRPGTFALFEIL